MNLSKTAPSLFAILMLGLSLSAFANESPADETTQNEEQQEEGVTEEPSILDTLFKNVEGETLTSAEPIDESNLEIRIEDQEAVGSFKSGANINVIDKTLGKLYKLSIPSNNKKSVKELSVRVNKCFSPDNKTLLPEGKALVEIYENVNGKNYRIFYGWMFAQSQSVAALNHAKWDVTLKSCFTKAGVDKTTESVESTVQNSSKSETVSSN